jgi:4,5-DOPA dioxygenase extradiol
MDISKVFSFLNSLTVVMSYENNHLLYDYYNFPEEMYKVKFQSKGSPAVASRIVQLLNQVSLY